jgi:hypothetical protein
MADLNARPRGGANNTARIEAIRKRLRTLEQELYQIERWGVDTYDVGTIVRWSKTFTSRTSSDEPNVYRYVAVKVNETDWYVTGSPEIFTWDRLIQNLWITECIVDEVYLVTDDLPLADLVESLRQVRDAETVKVIFRDGEAPNDEPREPEVTK